MEESRTRVAPRSQLLSSDILICLSTPVFPAQSGDCARRDE